MDDQTLARYEADAAVIAARHRAYAPVRLYALVAAHFHPAGRTADIGCGSGRDSAWLAAHGYDVVGFDASPAMLAEAHATYPQLVLAEATLPALDTIPDASFDNVLASAVLMHLPAAALTAAATALARILRPRGRLVLSWRQSQTVGEREEDGRLFTDIPLGHLVRLLDAVGLAVTWRETRADEARPEILWHTVVAERSALDEAWGPQRA